MHYFVFSQHTSSNSCICEDITAEPKRMNLKFNIISAPVPVHQYQSFSFYYFFKYNKIKKVNGHRLSKISAFIR